MLDGPVLILGFWNEYKKKTKAISVANGLRVLTMSKAGEGKIPSHRVPVLCPILY
jgi:hypothetical protein